MIRCIANGIGNPNGEGGLIYFDGWKYISLEHNYLTNITSYSKGAIMASYNCGNTTILKNCLVKTYTTDTKDYIKGQTFYIENQTENIEVEDNTAAKCPETTDITRDWITYFHNPKSLQIKQNNFSFCRLSGCGIINVVSPNEIIISRNTVANDTAEIVYEMYHSSLCTISFDNLFGVDHIPNNFGFFYHTLLGSSITDSLFISVKQVKLLDGGSITINSCLFFNCSFTYGPNIPTVKASTLPFTNTNTHFESYECIAPIVMTKKFTEESEFSLKAFLTHFIIAED